MFPVTLVGPRVVLREFQTDDAPAIFSYASNPIVSTYVPWETHADLGVTRDYLAGLLASARDDERSMYNLAVVTADVDSVGDGGRLIGAGRISVENVRHQRGDVGYVLHPEWWGKGVGTEVAALLIDFGFIHLGLHRIEATAHPDNLGSRRVLEKVGMTYEGHIRDHMLVSGTWRDSLSFAILDTDPRTIPATR
ncbi:GNAT family N-acetyltransferase [Actinopolymorpha alba]|uniref:GNAT family N-acetyltransferase n=1 Tax=Actinopolymorpha alba TaxID=533267 RepID=UPI00035DD1A8|nr:GNAT family protein [Actinopolymorpha alba]